MPEFKALNPVEDWHTYHYRDGHTVTISNVNKLAVSERGTHRLETTDGKKFIVPPGWTHMELGVKDWTV